MSKKILLIFINILFCGIFFGQVTDEEAIKLYRADEYGDKTFRKKGIMDGNLVRTIFRNDGQVGTWPEAPSGEWPKGSGHGYLDGVAALISAEVVAPGNNQIIHPLQTSYREEVDFDPQTNELWVFEPVPGYVNPSSEDPAYNIDPNTWPETWPEALEAVGVTDDWDGSWYGYFGKGVQNADYETFFVLDDSKDKEFTRPPYNYFPIAEDNNRGGLGLRVEVRGFQWSQVLAEDIIFWHYDIVNLSDRTYDNAAFGFYTDTGVGGSGDNADDNASFDLKLDITYAFDNDGIAPPDNWRTGYYGYAYLESPGNAENGLDDDQDGMIDERRDDGIDNDGDWAGFLDLNGNGVWDADENEPLNNDVGQDGIGPFSRDYTGPDFGEGDGLPTQGEPNFDRLDKDESDQIGLRSLSIYRLAGKGPTDGWPKNDEVMWNKMNSQTFDTLLQNSNISIVFGSGPFPLLEKKRERFSMALVFGDDLDDILFNKETVQQIYNANYNFSKPPDKPLVTAVPGDEEVFLFWDTAAEESRDPFLGFEDDDPTKGFKKDFEGYLIYRSTEPEFNDIKTITDSKGAPKFWKPIAQFDLKNGIVGPDPVGINGANFYRGDDTGLQHSYVDKDVTNGVTYYYAVVSYDQGDPDFGTTGLGATESPKIIKADIAGNITFVDINCAVVTPNAPAAGYKPPAIQGEVGRFTAATGTGSLSINILNAADIKDNASYKVSLNSEGELPNVVTTGYSIIKTANGVTDTLFGNLTEIGSSKFSPEFDGMTISVNNDTSISVIDSLTGWVVGTSNLDMSVFPDPTAIRGVPWPADYEFRWFDEPVTETWRSRIPLNFYTINVTRGDTVKVEIIDNDNTDFLTYGDEIVIIENNDGGTQDFAWRINYHIPGGNQVPQAPKGGDIFRIKTSKQFAKGDEFTFSTIAASVENEKAKEELSKIDVVPNPYVAAAPWESRNLNFSGRGERRIDFINLPKQCTVRIFTMNGALVKTLNKDTSPTNGALSWNLISEDGMDVAFGVYVYHVDAPGIGEHIGKFALIK
jgi:hypothetical protein